MVGLQRHGGGKGSGHGAALPGVCLARVLGNILMYSTNPGAGEEEAVTWKAQGTPPRSPSWKAEEPDSNPGIVCAAHGSGPSHCGCCCLTRGQSPRTGAVTVGYTPGFKSQDEKKSRMAHE